MGDKNFVVNLAAAMLILAAAPCQAHISKLAPQDRAHLMTDKFRIVTKTSQIPASVRQAFSAQAHMTSFDMADAGQPYQAGDVIMQKGLPWRRLIFAGIAGDRCFLFSERGGIAHSYSLLLFHLSKTKADLRWAAIPQQHPTPTDLATLRRSLQADQWDDSRVPFW